MTPITPDLNAYVLGELPEKERKQVERYLASDPDAAAEVERLRLVTAMLRHLPEEDPPRRIAFVSDKVFEPTWFQALWSSAPRAGLASASMLSLAILAHALIAAPQRVTPPSLKPEEISRQVEVEVGKRVDMAVNKAVAAVRAEADSQSHKLVATALSEAERQFALDRQADRLAVEANFDTLRKQLNRVMYLAGNQYPQKGAGQ